MGWTKLAVLTLFLIVIFTVSVIGGHFGYTVDGVPQGGAIESEPGFLGAISWAWNGLGFFYNMVAFNIDGVPTEISVIFLIMSLITIYMIVSTFLPGGSG